MVQSLVRVCPLLASIIASKLLIITSLLLFVSAAYLHVICSDTIITEFFLFLPQIAPFWWKLLKIILLWLRSVWVSDYVFRIGQQRDTSQSHSLLSMKGVTCISGIFTLLDHLTHHTKHSNALLGLLTVLFISSWQCGEWQSLPMVCQCLMNVQWYCSCLMSLQTLHDTSILTVSPFHFVTLITL